METTISTKSFKDSSTILRIDFDPILESLKVYFKSGGIYEYCGVPQTIFEDFSKASSPGKFFVSKVKNEYDFLKKASLAK